MLAWGCFLGPPDRLVWYLTTDKTDRNIDRFVHENILDNTMQPYAEEEMPLIWQFQQDNEPKHSLQLQKKTVIGSTSGSHKVEMCP